MVRAANAWYTCQHGMPCIALSERDKVCVCVVLMPAWNAVRKREEDRESERAREETLRGSEVDLTASALRAPFDTPLAFNASCSAASLSDTIYHIFDLFF